jgi:hypothetical protein
MKNLLFLFILTNILSLQLAAQSQSVAKGRFYTTEGTTVKFESLTMGDLEHQYQVGTNKTAQTIAVDKVVRIERQTGSEAGKWALWLGLSGLVGSTLGVLQAHNQNNANGLETSHKADAPIIIGITAASAGIGAAIGSGKKKYETVYTNPKYGILQPHWQVNLLAYGGGGGMSLKYTF